MKYWWVSHNQTFRQEVDGNYMWSPKVTQENHRSQFYENMRETARGDFVFSFNDTKIMALGIVEGPAYTCPKPAEFGKIGANWKDIGWRVDVSFKRVQRLITPREHMDLLRPLLPEKYSPLQARGKGNLFYLTAVPEGLGEALLGLIGPEGAARRDEALNLDRLREDASIYQVGKDEIMADWNKLIDKEIDEDPDLDTTERKEMKPWRVSNNRERLDGENGFLLTPSIDHLFGNGYLSFKNNGDLIISVRADQGSLVKMGVPLVTQLNVGAFSRKQSEYLEYHRDEILLQARG